MNIWKTLFIGLVLASLVIGGGVKFYNSDWLVNKTMKVKVQTDKEIGKRLKWDYANKYEDGKLKIAVQLKNVDPKMMDLIRKFVKDDEEMMKIVLLDKDDFKIKEIPVELGEFISDLSDKNEYSIQTVVKIDKTEVRKIKDVTAIYKTALDKTQKDFLKEVYGK